MMSPAFAIVNQQFMVGYNMGQQGMFAERAGNLTAAAQFYDRAISSIQSSMMLSQQSGMYIPDNVYFTVSLAHFNAARVKNALGLRPVAMNHLHQSLVAINQAIAINPSFFQYYVNVGTVLMALGNISEAKRAFMDALRLNPSEPRSQHMLKFLSSARGSTAKTNWLNTVVDVVAMLSERFGTPEFGADVASSSGEDIHTETPDHYPQSPDPEPYLPYPQGDECTEPNDWSAAGF